MISISTREQIKVSVGDLFRGVLERFDPENPNNVLADDERLQRRGRLKPFHRALLPPALNEVSSFERSLSTALGAMFEVTAELIGHDNFAESHRQFDVRGHISSAARAGIDGITDEIRNDGFNAQYGDYVNAVVGSFHSDQIPLSVRADLYLRTRSGEEIYLEMKSPQPNLDQCISVTRKLLELHAIRREGPPNVSTFYAMSYNPYGSESENRWSLVQNYLDTDDQVLCGSEFWELVGGIGTYEAVLEIFAEIGEENRTTLLEIFG